MYLLGDAKAKHLQTHKHIARDFLAGMESRSQNKQSLRSGARPPYLHATRAEHRGSGANVSDSFAHFDLTTYGLSHHDQTPIDTGRQIKRSGSLSHRKHAKSSPREIQRGTGSDELVELLYVLGILLAVKQPGVDVLGPFPRADADVQGSGPLARE